MHPFTLGPLQSRMLAITIGACFLLTSHTSTRPFMFAYAAENGAAPELSHNSHPVVPLALSDETTYTEDGHREGNGGYMPEFAYFARSLLGRQAEEVGKLKNDEKLEIDIDPDTTVFFILEKGQIPTKRDDIDPSQALDVSGMDTVEARYTESEEDKLLVSRQTRRQVWISANTCRQPMPKGGKSPEGGPQLVLYASTSAENQKPGPVSTNNLVTNSTGIPFDRGFVSLEVNTTSDVYIGISAPKLDEDWFGSWHFEIAASAEGSFHSHNKTDPFLFMVDTDSESTLFITYNLTNSSRQEDVDRWRKTNPFSMYAFPAGERSPVTGMENSVCALQQKFDKSNNLTVEKVITTKFGSSFPKSQFDVHGLENNQTYNGYLVVNGNQETLSLPGVGRVRGGGRVFQQFTWTTKVDDSCQVLTDLDFCDSVAYAVPSSPKFKLNDDELKKLYDDQARKYFQNFENSLDQVACDATSTSKYSLARTCDDCRRDYKDWLCSVLIPRCEDWTATDDWLQMRNVNAQFADNTTADMINSTQSERFAFSKSRNPMIDMEIKPGPYKEVLPCVDMCFDIVRSCPASLQFACPNQPARKLSYGERDPTANKLWCNFPGAVVKLTIPSAANMVGVSLTSIALGFSLIAVILFMK